MLDKSFHFVCFPKFFLILCVSHHFCLVFGQKTLFFAQNRVYTKLLLFLKKYENFSISLIIGVYLNNHNLFQFEAFGTSKVCRSISNTQTFHFLEIVLVCLFPINIRDFKQKKAFFGQKQGKNGGKQTKSKTI